VGEAAQGVARNGFPHAVAVQNGSFSEIFPRLLCSRALMRDFAVAVLARKR
jgi:hypothetical protein